MAFIDYYRQGVADKESREEQARQRKFGELAGTLSNPSARPAALQQMSAINPGQALQFGKFYQDQDAQAAEAAKLKDREGAMLSLNKVRVIRTAPKGKKLPMIQQVAPEWYAQNMADGTPPTDDEIDAYIDSNVAELYSRAGVAMPEPQQETFTGQPQEMMIDGKPGLGRLGSRGTLQQVPGAAPYQAPQKPTSAQFVTLSAPEIAAAGLPPGTSAQRDTSTGKIDVISRRDNTGVLSQKDATTAKMKLNTVALARKQLEDIRTAFLGAKDKTGKRSGGIKGTYSAGPVQGYTPTEGGQKFDAAVDQMRSTLTSLTRIPGVGAMSDYETKLDQAKFPSRLRYEAVTEQQIQALEDQLALIENGYRGLIEGSAPQTTQPPVAQSGPVRVSSPEEAMALPPGTQFQTPDGRLKVRP